MSMVSFLVIFSIVACCVTCDVRQTAAAAFIGSLPNPPSQWWKSTAGGGGGKGGRITNSDDAVKLNKLRSFPPCHYHTSLEGESCRTSRKLATKMGSYSDLSTKLFLAKSPLDEAEVKLGFVGCGTIASSIVTGLLTQTTFHHPITSVAVSKRSETKSLALKETFPNAVTVYENNQDVVDKSDIVFLCVLPQQTKEVVSSITFDKGRHTLVSLVATSKLRDLASGSGLSPDHVYKMICLPPVAKQQGVCLLVPRGNEFLKFMFQSLGGCVECDNEDIMNAMMVPGCLMGPMYGILRNNRDWLIEKGVPAKDASYFIGKQYLSILQDAERYCDDPHHFDALIDEQTPGGLNEQALKNLEGLGVFEAYDLAMDAILSRLEGKSDGSVPPGD